jgi:pyruvate decarboxylase
MVGGLSVINAIAGAYSEDLPLLVISGGPNTNDQKEGHRIHHTIGESNLYQSWKCFDSVVEKCFVIKNLHDAPAMIDNAISMALKAQKPVYLEIPCNLALQLLPAPCPMDAMRRSVAASDAASLEACTEHILYLLGQAKRPILVAGNKLRKLNAKDDFILLANALG